MRFVKLNYFRHILGWYWSLRGRNVYIVCVSFTKETKYLLKFFAMYIYWATSLILSFFISHKRPHPTCRFVPQCHFVSSENLSYHLNAVPYYKVMNHIFIILLTMNNFTYLINPAPLSTPLTILWAKQKLISVCTSFSTIPNVPK